MSSMPIKVAFATTLCALSLSAAAVAVAPTSYVATPAASGAYADTGGIELTDGVIGVAGWGVNSSRWVGWELPTTTINIDFNFASVTNITEVAVGSTQDSTYGLLRLPNVLVSSWDGSNWVAQSSLNTPFTTANDFHYLDTSPHAWLTLSGLNFSSDKVRVTLTSNGQKWVFADEVTFQGAPVPEPSAYLLALAALTLPLLARRRRPKA